jgi:hypothetical protein
MTKGEFIIFTPEGAEDYRVGVQEVKIENLSDPNNPTVMWVKLHDGRKVRILLPAPIVKPYSVY